MDGGDGCTTVWMYLVPLNWTLKNGSYKLYYMCYHKKRNEIKKELTENMAEFFYNPGVDKAFINKNQNSESIKRKDW